MLEVFFCLHIAGWKNVGPANSIFSISKQRICYNLSRLKAHVFPSEMSHEVLGHKQKHLKKKEKRKEEKEGKTVPFVFMFSTSTVANTFWIIP